MFFLTDTLLPIILSFSGKESPLLVSLSFSWKPSPGNEEGNLTLAQGMMSKERSIKLVTSPLAKMVLYFRVKLIKKTRWTLHLVGLFFDSRGTFAPRWWEILSLCLWILPILSQARLGLGRKCNACHFLCSSDRRSCFENKLTFQKVLGSTHLEPLYFLLPSYKRQNCFFILKVSLWGEILQMTDENSSALSAAYNKQKF